MLVNEGVEQRPLVDRCAVEAAAGQILGHARSARPVSLELGARAVAVIVDGGDRCAVDGQGRCDC